MAQTSTTTYPGGAVNWTALPWSGGTPPITNGATYTENLVVGSPSQISTGDVLTMNISFTLNGNVTFFSSGSNPTINIPAGVTIIINGNFTDDDNNVNFIVNGTLIVTGTLKGKNNAVLSGSGSISGGTIDLGNGASCSGSCPGLNFQNCTAQPAFCSANVTSGSTYIWNGSASSNWQTASNWTPTRTTPASTDFLTFSASGSNKAITNIPSQSVGGIFVTGNSTYSFTPVSNGLVLTLTKTTGYAFQIDNGSVLTLGVTAGNALNCSMPTAGIAQIGGQLNLANGNFSVGGATLILHTSAAPLARVGGQVSTSATTVLKLGDTGLTGGSTIVLPDGIFVSAPTIASLILNRTNGASLGDQSITISTSATFTLGNLTTNAAGRIKFSSTAANPTESSASKIIGYAEMASRAVGTGALNFLGLNMASGANNVGNMTITRRTGASGINVFNSNQSIASTWDLTSGAEPVSGRSISFSWQSAFDNVTTSSNRFQAYIFNSGPGWTSLGTLQFLAAVGPPRQTANVTTTKLNDTFTVTDESQSLPIELIYFSGTVISNAVKLNWATASELNFDYFNIEKSTDGKEFKVIGKVNGAGTSNKRIDYQFIDEKPTLGKSYYRLTEVDLDGYTKSFKIIAIDYTSEKTVSLFPNPIAKEGESLSLEFNFVPKGLVKILVTDLHGSTVGEYEGSGERILFPLQATSGMYLVSIYGSDFRINKKLIIR
ncbi:MAG: T9SS type A sorting domain-containing protein [Cyclobacteriaceae bacterium]|nr:T9SS type A sorting domain-containing protein [Cyclobacteriaceae bacterium]